MKILFLVAPTGLIDAQVFAIRKKKEKGRLNNKKFVQTNRVGNCKKRKKKGERL